MATLGEKEINATTGRLLHFFIRIVGYDRNHGSSYRFGFFRFGLVFGMIQKLLKHDQHNPP